MVVAIGLRRELCRIPDLRQGAEGKIGDIVTEERSVRDDKID